MTRFFCFNDKARKRKASETNLIEPKAAAASALELKVKGNGFR